MVQKLENFRGNLMLVRRRRRGPGLLGLTLATIVGIAGGYYIWKPAFEELRKGKQENWGASYYLSKISKISATFPSITLALFLSNPESSSLY